MMVRRLSAKKFAGIEQQASSKPAAIGGNQAKTETGLQQKLMKWEFLRSTVVVVRDGCEPIFTMLQQMSENYDHARKIEERDLMYQNQREVIGTCVHQQQILMSFINKNNHPTLATLPSDENSLYSFSNKEIKAEQV
jgi:hypothetical protein